MSASRAQLDSLTGLRFFAAMTVVLYHLRIYFSALDDALAIFSYGFTGVSFFFILSGFVLTWSHRPGLGRWQFYWNRVARIWPLHVLTMMLAVLVPSASFASSSGWAAVPFVLTLTQAWLPASPFLYSFNTVSWSLSCEAFFYLLFPLLFKSLVGRAGILKIAGMILVALISTSICLSVYASIPVADYLLATMPLYRLGEFSLGMCLAVVMQRGWRPKFGVGQAAGFSTLTVLGLFAVPLILEGTSGHLPVIAANLVVVPGFLALIAAAASRDFSRNRTILSSVSLVRLGRWSFALYLVHELVIKLTKPFLSSVGMEEAAWAAALVALACIALSGALHEFVEKPAEKWLRSVGTRWAADKTAGAEVQHPEK